MVKDEEVDEKPQSSSPPEALLIPRLNMAPTQGKQPEMQINYEEVY